MFLKNPDAVIGPGDTIMLPEFTEPWMFMHEAELALVIKGPAKMVKAENWRSAVFGYTGMIDVSARGDGPPHLADRRSWTRQILRYVRADRSLHHHCRRDPRAQRSAIVLLERRAAPPRLQYRRHGASRARAHRVRDDGDDARFGRRHRLRHQSRGAGLRCRMARPSISSSQHIGKMTLKVRDPLKRKWERGVYMGADSTNPEAVMRHRPKS